jgi:hypothetical protein
MHIGCLGDEALNDAANDTLEATLTRHLTNAVFGMPIMSAAVVIVRE